MADSDARNRKPPSGLGVRGRAFWRTTVAAFELEDAELALLTEICRLLDECERLHDVVEAEGVSVAGSAGQVRVNPALGELRQHRLALGKLLGQLALPDAAGDHLRTPVGVRGRKAAATRWAPHNAGKARLEAILRGQA